MMTRIAIVLVMAGLLYGSCAAFAAWPSPYYPSLSMCGLCGITRRTRDMQLPLTNMTLRTTHEPERHTKLSQLLAESGAIESHAHSWQFVRGAGNGVR